MKRLKYKNYRCWLMVILAWSMTGCTKDALNVKPSQNLAIPSTVTDYQDLLNGLTDGIIGLRTVEGDYMSDDGYVSQTALANTAYDPFLALSYTWDKTMMNEFIGNSQYYDWSDTYSFIEVINVALDGINSIKPTVADSAAWANVKGAALFLRSAYFFSLANLWSEPYNAGGSNDGLGIVMRLSSNIADPVVRSTVAQTYDQIISDLQQSVTLLPNTTASGTVTSKVRPSKVAAYGLLARTYLLMGNPGKVKAYCDSALTLYSTLLDYNSVDPTVGFTTFEPEIIFEAQGSGSYIYVQGFVNCDSTLYQSYAPTDLRKVLYFIDNGDGTYTPGGYLGGSMFNGISVDELYLMRAEANARLGQTTPAMADLNTLLKMRFSNTVLFQPYTATDANDALAQILIERRKELLFRGLRWMDLRRLNQESRFAITLTHLSGGKTYTLPPNDHRYTLPIPANVLAIDAIPQTP